MNFQKDTQNKPVVVGYLVDDAVLEIKRRAKNYQQEHTQEEYDDFGKAGIAKLRKNHKF